jgi:REP element-mobilizing transposase RayT
MPITGHMRPLRTLARGVWYDVRSGINNREPLLRKPWAVALFFRVFEETRLRFPFEVRGLRIEANRISFYIKPEDGLALPRIMQWMKEVFARRYNALTGRSGHIWGDRYWSRILVGEPAEGAEAYVGGAVEREPETGDRPRKRKRRSGPRFPSQCPRPPAPAWGENTETTPAAWSKRHEPSPAEHPAGKIRLGQTKGRCKAETREASPS